MITEINSTRMCSRITFEDKSTGERKEIKVGVTPHDGHIYIWFTGASVTKLIGGHGGNTVQVHFKPTP